MAFPAHLYDGRVQSCTAHCRNTADYAGASLRRIALTQTGYLAGLLHDCGKFSAEFSEYITAAAAGRNVPKSVIHSFAGVNVLLSRYHQDPVTDMESLNRHITAEVIAFAIGSHHGMFDALSFEGENGYAHRRNKQPEYDKRAAMHFFEDCCPESEVARLFSLSCEEIGCTVGTMKSASKNGDEFFFHLGMLARLVTSAVIEGDRRDTAEFAANLAHSSGADEEAQRPDWRRMSDALRKRLEGFPADSEIQRARRAISDHCADFATAKSGIYRLNVPTGAGKTLSGLRYAVEHCLCHGKSRILYVSPLISITEQNAAAIREAIGNEYVLEHHSNVISDSAQADENSDSTGVTRRALEESWNSPVIVTTMVQLLNTLFSDRTSCIRRMNRLCDSVILIDEVQTVPTKMLTLFNLAMNFLSAVCGASILLCSATQPCLESVPHSILLSPERMIPPREEGRIREIFRRNRLIDAGTMAFSEMPDFVEEIAEDHSSVLVICNKRAEAAELWSELNARGLNCRQLTSSMCMAHRRATLKEIYAHMANNEKIICVATQVIEAGVDISFEAVIRLTAGLDNLIQAAGRCNRSGEYGSASPVYSVNCSDENLTRLAEISRAKAASLDLMTEYRKHPETFNGDLSSDQAVAYYYRSLYQHLPRLGMDYPVKDHPTLYSLLSDNASAVHSDGQYYLRQAFKTAGQLFQAIDSLTSAVLVPFGEGEEIIAQLCGEECLRDPIQAKALLRKANAYTVSLYDYELKKLQAQGALQSVCGGLALALLPDYYDNNIGVITEIKEESNCSILIL